MCLNNNLLIVEWEQKLCVLIWSLGLKTYDIWSSNAVFSFHKVGHGVPWHSFNHAVENNAIVDGKAVRKKEAGSLDGLMEESQSDNLDFLSYAIFACERIKNSSVLYTIIFGASLL